MCLVEYKEVKFDYDEDDNGEIAEQVIIDNEKYIDIKYFAKRIKELEEQLANAIVPKFKIGQCAWFVYNKDQLFPFVGEITDFKYTHSKGKFYYSFNAIDNEYELYREDCFFVTRKEAEVKLEELRK